MITYRANECMIAWNLYGDIEVGPWPDEIGWSKRFKFTSGACYQERHECGLQMNALSVLVDFHTIVIRDGVDPAKAHREFLKIREYRYHISPDISGAEVFDQDYAAALGREIHLTKRALP